MAGSNSGSSTLRLVNRTGQTRMAVRDRIVHILKSYVLKSVTIGFAILWIALVIWLLHGYAKGAYWNAKRARAKGDIEQAVMLFKETVYEDIKLSRKALLALEEMDDILALEALVDLIDLPEMNKVTYRIRTRMCDVIRRRTAGTTADSLPLNPYAAQEVRAEQKRQWQAWLSRAKEQYNWQDGRFVPKEYE
jgi:hypothetical protein